MTSGTLCRSIADLWKAITLHNRPGIYLFEIRRFPELEDAVELFESIFEFMNGYFANYIRPNGILDFCGECDFTLAETRSRNFGLGRKVGSRGFSYQTEEHNSRKRTISYLIDYNDSTGTQETNRERVVNVNQPSTALLASVLAFPIIGKALDKKILGLLFEEHQIDLPNLIELFSYYGKLESEEGYKGVRLYLLVVSEALGQNEAFFMKKPQRVGILKDRFSTVVPYSACIKRIETISGIIRKQFPFVLFLGAGASAGSAASGLGLPLGDDLTKISIKSVLNQPELENASLEVLKEKFKDWLVESNHLIPGLETRETVEVTLERALREEFSLIHPSNSPTLKLLEKKCENVQPSTGYVFIRKLIETGYHPILITTNYDIMLERVLKDPVICCTDVDFANKKSTVLSYINGSSGNVPVLKIHGSIKSPKSIMESVNHTHKLPPRIYELLDSILVGEINVSLGSQNIPTFFVGYGFGDQDVKAFFSSQRIFNNMKAYVVNPSPSSITPEFFVNNGIPINEYLKTLISLPFSIFTSALFTRLTGSDVQESDNR